MLAISIGSFFIWTRRHSLERLVEQASIPSAAPYQAKVSATPITPTNQPHLSPTVTSPTTTLPREANLAVPFTVQAPHANWDDPYGEFCEEASVLMAISYVRNQPIPNPDFADQELNKIKDWEESTFGYYKDTTAAETARISREYYNYDQVELVNNPTVTDIKQAVAAGKLVLVPAAGRSLGNPYFQTPGPLYHMLVVKGYTSSGKFITNDPGTRHGADFLYDEQVIMNAMHDWRDDRNIDAGAKVILVVG